MGACVRFLSPTTAQGSLSSSNEPAEDRYELQRRRIVVVKGVASDPAQEISGVVRSF